jgi:hypothetical protein
LRIVNRIVSVYYPQSPSSCTSLRRKYSTMITSPADLRRLLISYTYLISIDFVLITE